jgi:hypothetical protein
MSRMWLAAGLVAVAMGLVGGSAPSWTRVGPWSYEKAQPGTVYFKGYSGAVEDLFTAHGLATKAAADDAVKFVLVGGDVNEFFPEDMRKELGFERMPGIIEQSLHDAFMSNFDVDIFFQEQYVNKRRDTLEVRYEVYHLYGIPRVPLAEVIRSAKDKVELRIFRHQLGGSDAARRRLADQAKKYIDHLADLVLTSA